MKKLLFVALVVSMVVGTNANVYAQFIFGDTPIDLAPIVSSSRSTGWAVAGTSITGTGNNSSSTLVVNAPVDPGFLPVQGEPYTSTTPPSSTPASAGALQVLDASGNTVAATDAAIAGFNTKSNIKQDENQAITISANVAPSLTVGLSATDIVWTINKPGTYQAKAVDIDVANNVAGKPVYMKVQDVSNLRQVGGTAELSTKYAVAQNTSIPQAYDTASIFNNKSIPLAAGKNSLWNNIEVPQGTAAGNFSDTFTVTFSNSL